MAASPDPSERIVATHPEVGKIIVTRRQLEGVYAERGFKEVKGADPDNPSPLPDTLPAPEPESKPKEPRKSGGSK